MVTDKDHRDETVGARAERTIQRIEARGSILRATDPSPVPTPSIGSGGPQKPFSSLSEGVGGVFTIDTEDGERLVSPLHILGITMCSWLVVRVNIA
jgi:hypothetical protein